MWQTPYDATPRLVDPQKAEGGRPRLCKRNQWISATCGAEGGDVVASRNRKLYRYIT